MVATVNFHRLSPPFLSGKGAGGIGHDTATHPPGSPAPNIPLKPNKNNKFRYNLKAYFPGSSSGTLKFLFPSKSAVQDRTADNTGGTSLWDRRPDTVWEETDTASVPRSPHPAAHPVFAVKAGCDSSAFGATSSVRNPDP